jgi:hypothetical protein
MQLVCRIVDLDSFIRLLDARSPSPPRRPPPRSGSRRHELQQQTSKGMTMRPFMGQTEIGRTEMARLCGCVEGWVPEGGPRPETRPDAACQTRRDLRQLVDRTLAAQAHSDLRELRRLADAVQEKRRVFPSVRRPNTTSGVRDQLGRSGTDGDRTMSSMACLCPAEAGIQ